MLVVGEPVLRREAARGAGWSCQLGGVSGVTHRADLVLLERGLRERAVAIEVELTSKSPPRLEAIVRGWARSREVDGVVYLASPAAERAVQRAIERVGADPRVLLLPLAELRVGR
jgi:hypothetical protein